MKRRGFKILPWFLPLLIGLALLAQVESYRHPWHYGIGAFDGADAYGYWTTFGVHLGFGDGAFTIDPPNGTGWRIDFWKLAAIFSLLGVCALLSARRRRQQQRHGFLMPVAGMTLEVEPLSEPAGVVSTAGRGSFLDYTLTREQWPIKFVLWLCGLAPVLIPFLFSMFRPQLNR